MQVKIMHYLLPVLVASTLIARSALAFDEGIDYKAVSAPQITETPGKVEVLELFWYGCPHCYHLEPELAQWLAKKPEYIAFRRMPAVLGDNWAMGAKVFYAAELLGVIERLNIALFKAIQEEHLDLNNQAAVADWFAMHGVNRDDFLKALNAFVVDIKVRRSTQIAGELGLDGVPSFLVNGKFLTSPSMTASVETAFKVINELAAREAHVKDANVQPPTK